MRKHVEESVATGAAAGRGRGGRFSAGRKREVVMRLLRGEDLESVSRAVGITAARASHWRAQFLAAGQAGLKSRATGCPGRRPSSAAGQDRRAADGDRVAVCEGGPAGGQRPFGPAEVDAMSGARPAASAARVALWSIRYSATNRLRRAVVDRSVARRKDRVDGMRAVLDRSSVMALSSAQSHPLVR